MLPCPDCCTGAASGARDVLLAGVAAFAATLLLLLRTAAAARFCPCCSRSSPHGLGQYVSLLNLKGVVLHFFMFSLSRLRSNFLFRGGHRYPSFLPLGRCVHFDRAEGSAFPRFVDCSLNVANSRSCAYGSSRFDVRKSPYEHKYAPGEARTFNRDEINLLHPFSPFIGAAMRPFLVVSHRAP